MRYHNKLRAASPTTNAIHQFLSDSAIAQTGVSMVHAGLEMYGGGGGKQHKCTESPQRVKYIGKAER